MGFRGKKSWQEMNQTPEERREKNLFKLAAGLIRQQWIVAFVLVIAGIALLTNSSAWAAPVFAPMGQTVPIPTATPTPTPVPTVTPAPTSTPEPDTVEEPADDPADEPEEDEILEDDAGNFFDDEEEEPASGSEGDGDAGGDADDTAGDSDPAGDDSAAGEPEASDDAGGSNAGSDSVDTSANDTSANDTSAGDTGASDSGAEDSESAAAGAAAAGSAGAVSAVEPTGLTAKVAVIVLNVREEPSLESPVLGTVFQDDELEVYGRNGDWWLVCCAFGAEQPAWVNPDFLEPDFDLTQADELLPIIGQEPGGGDAASNGSVQAVDSSPNLELTMSLNPRYVWQGLTFDLEFVVRNVGDAAVTDVVLRDELLTELEFITAKLSPNGQVVKETLDNGNSLVSVRWDSIGAGQEERVSFSLRAVGDLEDGFVIDNLSVVGAAETSSTTAGISIGLPPASLPIFK